MHQHITFIRVRYSETDQMGYVYNGRYAEYLEVGRVESLRSLHMSYKEMEEQGVMLPVLHLEIKYIRPIKYDNLVEVRTTLNELPHSRIHFVHELYVDNELTTVAKVTLVFVDKEKNRPTKAPVELIQALSPFFNSGQV
jgi:acyl-CoA thioester hydrolase